MIELLIFIEFTIGEEGLMGKERKVYGIVAVDLFFCPVESKVLNYPTILNTVLRFS